MKRRLFTPKGNFVGWEKLHRGVFTALQAVIRKLFGKIPEVPWIPISARYRIEKILQPSSIVWEVGAGLSTLWLSSRAKKVTSIEASRESAGIQSVDLMKMDIEGFEYEAITGAEKLFKEKRIQALALEMHFDLMRARGKDFKKLESILRNHGYLQDLQASTNLWKR